MNLYVISEFVSSMGYLKFNRTRIAIFIWTFFLLYIFFLLNIFAQWTFFYIELYRSTLWTFPQNLGKIHLISLLIGLHVYLFSNHKCHEMSSYTWDSLKCYKWIHDMESPALFLIRKKTVFQNTTHILPVQK